MSSVSGNSIPPKVTLRRDPSTRVAHYGSILRFNNYWDDRWVTHCRRSSGIDTVFWNFVPPEEGPTCLWCLALELT
jgi:hypothetical protein